MARRVHGERSVGLLYGQRALLIGALEPLTYTGTMLSTRSADRPFERLARTAKIQETIFLGTRAGGGRGPGLGCAGVHETVAGTLPEAAGVHPAGTAYSAFDPELMLWTLAVIADSGREMYETLVRPLSAAEREGLWQDYVRFGELFGLPAQRGPGQLPRVRGLVGREARRARAARDRARARDGAAGRLPPAGAAAPRAATSRSRTTSSRARCRRGCAASSASAGAPPTSAAFRAIAAAHRRARRQSSPAPCAAAATTSSSTSSPAPRTPRRHPDAAAARPRLLSAPGSAPHLAGAEERPDQHDAVVEARIGRGPAGARSHSAR